MALQESGEMYLETIHVLSKTNAHVRSIDISERMGYSKPSVSRAVSILKQDGYILVDSDGFITLTDSGLQAADFVRRRATIAVELAGQGLTEEDRQVFYTCLTRIAANLENLCQNGLPDEL